MSAYTQPKPYVNATVLDTNDITENEESVKVFINQEIVAADIATGKLQTKDIARGTVVQNNASFVSSGISGIAQLQLPANRSYATSTAKNNNQTASIQWQDIANSGARVVIEETSSVIIHMYVKYLVNDNLNLAGNGGPGNGLWQNEIVLRRREVTNPIDDNLNGTDNYCFEGIGTSSDTLNPGTTGNLSRHRSIMLAFRDTVSVAGEYYYTATVNPHNEMGYATVKSMTVEVFPI